MNMQSALRNSGKTGMMTTMVSRPSFWCFKETNLHHGPFLFRHKGKKRPDRPNYPPTKLIVKAHRHMRRKLPADLKATFPAESRKARRDWTLAIIANNDKLRPQRVRKRALSQRIPARQRALGIQ